MLQGHTTAIVPCGNPTPKKLPTGGGEWPTFRTARAQRAVRPHGAEGRGVFSVCFEGGGPGQVSTWFLACIANLPGCKHLPPTSL